MTTFQHPLRLLLRTAIAIVAIAWPLTVTAAPPSVTGIHATQQNGAVTVTWDAPAGATTVAYYHVYESRKSILQNGGQYDDFETTTGKQTAYTLKSFPPTDVLYVSVLAVDDQGNESDFFAEEAKVNVNGGVSPPSPMSSSSSIVAPGTTGGSSSSFIPPPPTPSPEQIRAGNTVQLVSAASLSSTGVLLTFSESVTVTPTDALTAFHIDDGSGHTLALRRLIFQNNTVQITTVPQRQGIRYTIHVSPVVHARFSQPDGTQVPMDPIMNTASFGESGTETAPAPAPSAENVIPADILNLHLDPQPSANGTYTVTATWDIPADGSVTGQNVMQTVDGGQNYTPAQSIAANVHSIRINGVTPGPFGILIQTVSRSGNVSTGRVENIDLPGGSQPDSPATPPVILPKKDLTQSGPEVLVAFAITGAGMGWLRSRRKRNLT